MESNKTPGPDGFGASFFKTHWHTLKGDLIVLLNSLEMVNYLRNLTIPSQLLFLKFLLPPVWVISNQLVSVIWSIRLSPK